MCSTADGHSTGSRDISRMRKRWLKYTVTAPFEAGLICKPQTGTIGMRTKGQQGAILLIVNNLVKKNNKQQQKETMVG